MLNDSNYAVISSALATDCDRLIRLASCRLQAGLQTFSPACATTQIRMRFN